MLFALYGIMFLGGMYLMGSSFNVPGLEALLFVGGLLLTVLSLAVPFTASAAEHRGEKTPT